MKPLFRNTFAVAIWVTMLSMAWGTATPIVSRGMKSVSFIDEPVDSGKAGSDSLRYPFKDRYADSYNSRQRTNKLFLKDPSNVKQKVEYDAETGNYNITETIGKDYYRNPNYLTFDEYVKNEYKKGTKNYWKQTTAREDNAKRKKNLIPKIHVGGEAFDRIFGGNTIDIRPNGSAELVFAFTNTRNENLSLPEKQRSVNNFDFRERIQLNTTANIGDKLKLTFNYNTEATFDFENQIKLEYTGYEDEIIKKIDAGNVSLPLPTSLITGSQSLFGIKTQLQFGRLTVTSIFSQQKGKTSTIEVAGGAQTSNFNIQGDQYEANRHYFVSQYFMSRFDSALASLPIVRSNINITRIEVWITNRTVATENTRNIMAFMDLGENADFTYNKTSVTGTPNASRLPDNGVNSLYGYITDNSRKTLRDFANPNPPVPIDFSLSTDYERIENARKLSANDFTFNPKLGFISLNQPLNADEVLAVAYEYTINGKLYRVGELTNSGIAAPNALFLKLLKAKITNTHLPLWNLMMKNIYSIGAFQLTNKDFRLDVLYYNAAKGSNINYIPDGPIKNIPLITVLNCDKVNSQLTTNPDGLYDFIDGVTINSANGRVMFPVREPFGSYLRAKFNGDKKLADKYCFDSLYTTTKALAQQELSQNRFSLKGSYQSNNSSEISLNSLNVPQGSVKVYAGSNQLVENQDYTVDYNLGRVKIINEGVLASGVPLKISTESNSLFSIQTKTLMGSRFDFKVNKNFNIGATIMNLSERPITQKVNVGDEPISNTIFGFDGTYNTDSRFLTKMVDKIPFIDTKEPSSVTLSGEYAQLVPGHAAAIGKDGTSYIDDYEGTKGFTDLKNVGLWSLASIPQNQPSLFPEANYINDLRLGYNRAKLAWFIVDPLLTNPNSGSAPANIDKEDQSDLYTRAVSQQELFPYKSQAVSGQTSNEIIFNLAYFPKQRGPYNYDPKGVNTDGTLTSPERRWAGISRKLDNTDFEAGNYEFIEFIMMDPFAKGSNKGGAMYFNLGNISEDVLRDGRKSFENGLPTDDGQDTTLYRTTTWGRVPSIQALIPGFDNNSDARVKQDVGLDGLNDATEYSFRKAFIDSIVKKLGPTAASQISSDPSSDNFHYYKGDDYDGSTKYSILERYKKFNGPDGNSRITGDGGNAATNIPDNEDINKDNTLDLLESYYQYKVDLKPEKMVVGQNNITAVIPTTAHLANGSTASVNWYQFKIPIRKPDKVVGPIQDFKSIRFIRMFLKDFEDSVVCRFDKLQLTKSEWRRYNGPLFAPGEYTGDLDDFDNTRFELGTINLEEDGTREGIPYVIPPGIERQTALGSSALQKLNEQSLLMRVCGLKDGDTRATFKNTQFDVRNYKKIRLFVHGQDIPNSGYAPLKKGDLNVFIRFGTDFTENYYEYEVPLTPSAAGARSPEAIWLDANTMEIDVEKLQSAKKQRNGANFPITKPYKVSDGANTITVTGVPNLSQVRTIMIGIRNPRRNTGSSDSDDGLDKCAEVWVNELRLTDFIENGGWAATARINTKLADFANVNVSGSRYTPGFGTIEQKINERRREDASSYDVSSNFELGKFFPYKYGLRVPMFLSYSETFITPQYNPLDPDILLQEYLDQLPADQRKALADRTQDYTRRRSINFTNIKKTKVGNSKSHIYDIENFSLTYAYSEVYRRNITVENNLLQNWKTALGYNYSLTPTNVVPFSKWSTKNKWATPIKDFNFYYMPSSIAFRTDYDRQFSQNKQRNNTDGVDIPYTYSKAFTVSRNYDVKFDLTKSLKLDFTATNRGVVDEAPTGGIDTRENKELVKKNIFPGRTIGYHHTVNLNYNIPINKLPYLDFVNASYKYTADYDWKAGAMINGDIPLGNTIQNSTSHNINPTLNATTLFNKIPYYQRLSRKSSSKSKAPPMGSMDALKNSLQKADTTGKKKKTEKKEDNKLTPFDYIMKAVLSLKNVSGSYTRTEGTMLPGYVPRTRLMGMSELNGQGAPGLEFISGYQRGVHDPHNIRKEAASRGWLKSGDSLNQQFMQTFVSNYSIRANLEPLQGLRIDLNASRNYSKNYQEYFSVDNELRYHGLSPTTTGNLSISYLAIGTSFETTDKAYTSSAFEHFKGNRIALSERLGNEYRSVSGYDPNDPSDTTRKDKNYKSGFGPTSQQVLIPSFMAAYADRKSSTITTDVFKVLPMPNWRITYDGLSRIELFKKVVNSITLNHNYRSNFSVASYTTNLNYRADSALKRNLQGNIYPQYDIATVSVTEQYSPLIGVDITWKNNLLTRTEFKRDRTVNLSMTNIQVTEVNGHEYVFGIGYRFKELKMPIKIFGKQFQLENDLDLKLDVSFRHSLTIIRQVEGNTPAQPTAGSDVITIKTSADYLINERFNVRVFFDRVMNTPAVSTSYPNSNTSFGVSIRFTLSQ